MSKNVYRLFIVTTGLFYSILFYYSYQYYNDVELVEIPPKQCEIGYLGGGFKHRTENYIIYYQGKVYDRTYKTLGFSNWLWDYNDLKNNQMVQKDPIYFYRLKSEKDLKKTSRYFLPSAKKPITNKIILALDIWGYFMTNWFWYLALYVFGFIFLANNRKSEADDKDEQSKWYDKIFVIGYIALLLMTFFY